MKIVNGDQAPVLEHTEAVGLLQEMAAVVRTIFAVDVAPYAAQEAPQEIHPTTAGAGGVPGSGGAAPAPAVVPSASPAPPATPLAAPPASIPVPGVTLLQEIAFLDD
ncbi:hypothetical protein [Nocardioides aquiterrae]|uniref:Uncharacterized protein n=1 Tax=Nocardioides aquiterrae TaxID=203799 RepID=A0ABN1ULE4_9ACTN